MTVPSTAQKQATVHVDDQVPVITGADGSTCSWTSYSFLFGTEKCGNPGTAIVLSGCEHEHMIRSLTCDDCVVSVRRTMDAGNGLCTPCRDRGGQDGVPMRFIRVEQLQADSAGGSDA